MFFKRFQVKDIILIIQVVVSILLMILILTQNKDGGLSAVMGGGSQSFKSVKRGAEKVIYRATVILAFIFMANALAIAFF